MKPRTKYLLTALAVALGAWLGVALAQAAGDSLLPFLPNVAELFANPFALALAIGAAVEFVKQHWLKTLAGPAVIVLSFAVGAALGAGGHWAGYLAGSLVEGVAFGLVAAFIASGAYDLLKALLAKWNIALPVQAAAVVEGEVVVEPLALTSGGLTGAFGNAAVQFVLDQVKALVARAQLPAAIKAVAPLIAQLLQSPVVLNDDTRSELQGKVLSLLRKAGLSGVDL